MNVVGSHHVALLTANFAELRRFYGETLGLPEIGGYPAQRIVFFRAGSLGIELIGRDSLEPAGTAGWGHLALEVEDIDATVAELGARGVVFHVQPKGFPGEPPDARVAFFRDPDGNEVQLVQPLTGGYPDPRK